MPAAFPHRYEVALTWTDGDRSEIRAGDRPAIGGGSPAEFDGTDLTRWSPEHLLLAAATQCLLLTWVALNKRSAIPLKGWEATGNSVLDKTKDGLVFTSFTVKVRLTTDAARADEARRLLETAKKHCIVANELKTPVTLEAEVVAA